MDGASERDITRREIDTDAEEPAVEIAEAVADLEGKESTDLANLWDCTDHVLDHIFSDPPAPEAQMKVEFSYEGYRIVVEQDGTAEFIEVE